MCEPDNGIPHETAATLMPHTVSPKPAVLPPLPLEGEKLVTRDLQMGDKSLLLGTLGWAKPLFVRDPQIG